MEVLHSSAGCNSKRPRHGSNEIIIIDSDPADMSSDSISEDDPRDELTRPGENEDNDYRNVCIDSNISCQDDEYESEDLLDFTYYGRVLRGYHQKL